LVIVDQQTVEAIRSARLRLREITLPVVYGSQGERKRCPMREGKAVTLTARVPYAEHRARVERSPTRARAVLELIDLCAVPRKVIVVTPTSVQQDGSQWLIRFVKGDQSSDEPPLFCSPTRDYTTVSDVLNAGEVVLPSAEAMAHARQKAREKRDLPTANGAAALKLAQRKLAMRKHTMTVDQRRQLDRVGKAIEKLAAELALDSGGIFALSPVPSTQRPPQVMGDTASKGRGSPRPQSDAA
jgi:hypothetical protein